MKHSGLLVIFLLTAALATAAPRTLMLAGPITNTTGDVTAQARLVLTIDGEKLTAEIHTEAPLSGSGKMTGRLRDAWCELEGRLSEDVRIVLRGVLNEKDLRGTYIAAVPDSFIQYGKFQFAVEPAPSEPPKKMAPPPTGAAPKRSG
ncbi:MAG: hypothetical protein KA257_12265 [Opitutaceae bacterium]|nr:hypothetical protein [Opitutaceae bacterium]MBP9912571.1 hypothetical protein [Opitutaceae bacterium]